MDADQIARCLRTRLAAVLVATFVLGSMAVGCGDAAPGGEAAAGTNPPSAPEAAVDGIALVATDGGLAGVPAGTSAPAWTHMGAVAAPDGSAVFTAKVLPESAPGRGDGGFELIRIDPRTGRAETAGRQVPGPPGVHVAAVEPGGGRVALAAETAEPGRTTIVDFDAAAGRSVRQVSFEGRLEPEAYSLDRSLLFAARIYDDRYHVHVLDLATGDQRPTLGPDKAADPEDMYGSVVQAALSPDGTQLATLYRDSVKPEHTGFVHLLSLENGTTVCIDLHAPFGGPDAGRDAIAWQDDGTVAVGHRSDDSAGSVTATFDPAAIWGGDPQPHYHAEMGPDPDPTAVPEGVAATPGFQRFVALVPA